MSDKPFDLRPRFAAALIAAIMAPLPVAAADLAANGTVYVAPHPQRVFVSQDVYEESLIVTPSPVVRGFCGGTCGGRTATRTRRTAKERYWSRGVVVPAQPVRVASPVPRHAGVVAPAPQPRARPVSYGGARCLLTRCDR